MMRSDPMQWGISTFLTSGYRVSRLANQFKYGHPHGFFVGRTHWRVSYAPLIVVNSCQCCLDLLQCGGRGRVREVLAGKGGALHSEKRVRQASLHSNLILKESGRPHSAAT